MPTAATSKPAGVNSQSKFINQMIMNIQTPVPQMPTEQKHSLSNKAAQN